MANASADKLKILALHHGEKAVMTVTTMLCVLFLYKAAINPTIQLTPDDVQKAAQAAESNLNRQQKPDDILKTIEAQGIKNAGFETIVDQQKSNILLASNYRPRQLWVTPEPGAGLIRDAPELIAPTELFAYPGRGGLLVFKLDESGNRVVDHDAGKTQDEETTKRRASRGGGAGGARKRMEEERKKKEAEKQYKIDQARKNAAIAGTIVAKKEEAPADAAAEGPMLEITMGKRWVAITGVLNNKILRDNYLSALKQPEVAYPHFKQLDVERQVKQPDGTWTDWEAIDIDRNRQILDNLPEEDEEWTPETVRISALVAPLPFLKAGFWERVHVGRMVPKEKLEVAKPIIASTGGEAGGSEVMPTPQPVMESRPVADSSVMSSPGMAMYAGGGNETIDFEKTDADEIMIRGLDFTVDPDTTYRFRVRIVVYNPNREREDVSPGVDTKSIELFGPWSEPTEEVTMPPDVATYAMAKQPTIPRKLDQVDFQIARWNTEDGVTVVKRFNASPGELIGEYSSAEIPFTKEGKKETKNKRVDFNSHQVVLDVMGGDQPIPPLGPGTGGRLAIPVVALLVRPDGAVVLHSQASDVQDQVRKDMWDNYSRALRDAEEDKKKKTNTGGGSVAP